MSDKPTDTPDWTPTGADVVVPTAGEKVAGLQGGQRPPAQFINWFWEICTRWIAWVNAGILQRSSLTNDAPILQTCDRDARPRHYLDPNGYWMGCAIQETHRWRVDSGTFVATGGEVSPRMSATINAGTTVLLIPGSGGAVVSADPQLELTLASAAAANSNAIIFPTTGGSPPNPVGDMPISDIDNVVAVMEWAKSFNSATLTNCYFGVGLHEFADITGLGVDSNTSGFVGFKATTTDANFRAEVRDGVSAATSADTGIAIVADTMYTFKVEYHGANTPVGVANTTAPVARFFINGVQVHEETGVNVPVTADVPNFGPAAYGVVTNAPGADKTMSLRTIKCAWNGSLDFTVTA